MRHPHRILTAVALVVLLCPRSGAAAACPFQHPASAKSIKSTLVQAFMTCGGYFSGDPEPNATTEGGILSCYPAQTFNERAGSPPSGWLYGPRGRGKLAMRVGLSDVAITLTLDDIRSSAGFEQANGTGRLQMLVRFTLPDPAGPMTIIDFPLSVYVDVVNGKARLKTTINTLLDVFHLAPLPPCSNLELIVVQVLDANASPFARMGVFLP